MITHMLGWFKLRPDKKIETFYFKKHEDGRYLFYPLGQPGVKCCVTERQKKRFINVFTLVFILSMLVIASFIYPFEVSKFISIFGVFVIALNVRLFVTFVIPLLYVRFNGLNLSQEGIENTKVIAIISRSILIQYLIIFIGLLIGFILNIHIYFLWGSLMLLTMFSLFVFFVFLKPVLFK